MGIIERIKNIIRSNINHEEINVKEVDINNFEDIYYYDAKTVESEEQNSQDKKYYKVLELEYGADFAEIKKAYKKLLKKYHPDLFLNKPEKLKIAQTVTREINEAYTYFERKFL